MAISQPTSSDNLNSPDHSLMHRQIATDPSAAVQSLTVDASGNITGVAAITSAVMTKVSARRTASQSINASTWTKVQFTTTTIDTNSEFDVTTNYRFTAKNAGYYFVAAQVNYYSNTEVGVPYYIAVYKNGSEWNSYYVVSAGNNYTVAPNIFFFLSLAANDYIELYTYHTSSGAKTICYGAGDTLLQLNVIRIV